MSTHFFFFFFFLLKVSFLWQGGGMGMASNLSQGLGLSQGMDFLGGDNVGGDFGASGGAFDGAGGMMLSQDDPLGRMGGLSQGHSSAQVSALALFFLLFLVKETSGIFFCLYYVVNSCFP